MGNVPEKMNAPQETPSFQWTQSGSLTVPTSSAAEGDSDSSAKHSPGLSEFSDASESLEECPSPTKSGPVVTIFDSYIAVWTKPCSVPSSPIEVSFEPTLFPSVDSRTPTKRFVLSKMDQKSPMSVSGRFSTKFHRDDDDEKRPVKHDSSSSEEEDEYGDAVDGNKDSGSLGHSPSTSASSSATTLTGLAMKRQKKKEKKKARQMNKENLQKKQKLQRAEAQKVHEEKLAANKRMLAMYAAAVAKPTVAKTMREAEPSGETTHTSTVSVVLEGATPRYTLSSASSLSVASTSSSAVAVMPIEQARSPPASSSPIPPTTTTSQIQEAAPPSEETHEEQNECQEEEQLDEQLGEIELEEIEEEEDEQQYEEEQEEIIDEQEQSDEQEEFEVLVCGERRVVKPFTPRRHLNSASISDDQDSLAEENPSSAFDIPEHYPISVPFHHSQVAQNSQSSSQNSQAMSSQQQPRFVMMPMQMAPPPVIIGPPINTNFGPPPPYFQQTFGQSQFGSVRMMPVQPPLPNHQMPPTQMQRIHAPMMMNGQTMFVPPMMQRPPQMPMQAPRPPMPPMQLQPRTQIVITSQPAMQMQPPMPTQPQMHMPMHPPPPPQRPSVDFSQPPPPLPATPRAIPSVPTPMSQPPPQQPTRSVLYPSQRALSRPIRKPLDIVAPPEREAPKKTPKPTLEPAESQDVVEKPTEPEEKPVEPEVTESVQTPANDEDQAPEDQEKCEVPVVEQTLPRPGQSTSPDLNGELITAGVSVILDDSDDEYPTPPNPLPESSQQVHSEEQESLNRVLGFTKESGGEEFAIWTGFVNEMPPRPELLKAEKFEEMLELDQIAAECEKKKQEAEMTSLIQNVKKNVTLPAICKQMEPYFSNTRTYWLGAWVDGKKLRHMFEEAHGGDIPYSSWCILQKVCSFEPGYFHVFDALIGSKLEFTYGFQSVLESEVKEDKLRTFWRTLSQVGREMDFFRRFAKDILEDVLVYMSGRLISARTFVAIVEVVKADELSDSDRYYLAYLVWGTKSFYKRFNSNISQIQLHETGGKRWIRQITEATDSASSVSSRISHEHRAMTVPDFLTRLHPHIDDILQLLPDTVIDDKEFFKAAKLVCGWRGDVEELVWKSIVSDSAKYQEFYDSFRAFLRIEVRMGKMYMRKLAYTDDGSDEETVNDGVVPQQTTVSTSCVKSENQKVIKKNVSYASEPTSHANICTQTDNCDMDKIWDLERELIRQLKRDNVTFGDFIQTADAREMYQFLADIFKGVDLKYFSYILEKAIAEMHEQSWRETFELRVAAEEARQELESARAEHKKEQDKMETISRFETYEVQVELRARIDSLKEIIKQMTEQKESEVQEEVKEEKAAMQREKMELMRNHQNERRLLEQEIARLKCENGKVLTEEDVARELAQIEQERAMMMARCEHEMNKSRKICEETSQLLRDSQHEIMNLRRENQQLSLLVGRANLSAPPSFVTPEPEPMPDILPLSFLELSPQSQLKLSAMEKMKAEIKNENFRSIAQKTCEFYCSLDGVNRKDRKSAEKQLKEYEEKLDIIESAIEENIDLLKLNVVEGLVAIPPFPLPFTEKVMQKMSEATDRGDLLYQQENKPTEIIEEEEDCCLICYDVVDNGSTTLRCDTCSKEYHHSCISQWLTINSVCPACFRGLKDPVEFPSLR